MPAGIWTPTNQARTIMWNRYVNGGSAITFKTVLVTSASNIGPGSTTYASLTGELSTANGYTAGGAPVTLTPSGTTSVQVVFGANPVWTASGSGLTARTAAVVDSAGNIMFYVALDTTNGGQDVSVAAGNTLTIDSDGTPSPVITIA
ncbi:hypothetical protein [Mycolicibacterium goodii]|uniref:hypothetical protein n=1 Tax=Mycolicibacterium goodii TaxID=134601 RepID=UPI001BDD99A9|nr:hypothetical protein [Mycolicibacterium goodii]MBU8830819.1 hypothetical protein [Mycolicibacterium goodii]